MSTDRDRPEIHASKGLLSSETLDEAMLQTFFEKIEHPGPDTDD